MKRLHKVRSLFLVLTLAAACRIRLRKHETEHRDPRDRRHDRRRGGDRHTVRLYLRRRDHRRDGECRSRDQGPGEHQGRADLERRIAGHELRHHAEARQADQRIAADARAWTAS